MPFLELLNILFLSKILMYKAHLMHNGEAEKLKLAQEKESVS